MNQAVLVANGGKFPVMVNDRNADFFGLKPDGYMDETHYRMSRETKLNWLADFINLKTRILSPGDMLIMLGDSLWSYMAAIWSVLLVGDVARARKQ